MMVLKTKIIRVIAQDTLGQRLRRRVVMKIIVPFFGKWLKRRGWTFVLDPMPFGSLITVDERGVAQTMKTAKRETPIGIAISGDEVLISGSFKGMKTVTWIPTRWQADNKDGK